MVEFIIGDNMPLEFILDEKKETTYTGNAPDGDNLYDVIILGAGPAGMTAAVYASRKMMNALLITENIGGQPLLTSAIENYMGYQYITGRELSERFSTQMRQFPIAILEKDGAKKISGKFGDFSVETKNGKKYRAKSLIITTGKRYRELGVPGEKDLVGKGVAYCAVCDAPLFKGKDVAVVGGGNSALTSVIDLMKIARKIYLINNLDTLQGDPILQEKIKSKISEYMLGYSVTAIGGQKSVESITVKSKSGKTKTIPVDGVFIEIGLMPNSDFAEGFLKLNEQREIVVDCQSRTSVEGVFAAGDVTSVPEKQIIVAAGEGAKAALGAYRHLVNKK